LRLRLDILLLGGEAIVVDVDTEEFALAIRIYHQLDRWDLLLLVMEWSLRVSGQVRLGRDFILSEEAWFCRAVTVY
jgi:hypothetical protein